MFSITCSVLLQVKALIQAAQEEKIGTFAKGAMGPVENAADDTYKAIEAANTM